MKTFFLKFATLSVVLVIATGGLFAQEQKLGAKEAFEQFRYLLKPHNAVQQGTDRAKQYSTLAASPQGGAIQTWPQFIVRANKQFYGTGDMMEVTVRPQDDYNGIYQVTTELLFPDNQYRYPSGNRADYFNAENTDYGYFYKGFSRSDVIKAIGRPFSSADSDGSYTLNVVIWSTPLNGPRHVVQQNFISVKLNYEGNIQPWDGSITGISVIGDSLEIIGRFPAGTPLVIQETARGGLSMGVAEMFYFPDANVIRTKVTSGFGTRANVLITVMVLGDLYSSTVPITVNPQSITNSAGQPATR